MVDYKELKRILNSGSSVKHYSGKSVVTDSSAFKGVPMSKMDEAVELVEASVREETENHAKKCGITTLDTLKTVTERAERSVGGIIDCIKKGKSIDSKTYAENFHNPTAIRDSFLNDRTNIGNMADPMMSNMALPNIYISPWEASSLYSQKGIFETIINKKAKATLLNGCTLENPKFSQRELDKVAEKMEVLNFNNVLGDSILYSLVYGGELTFPMFRKDNPITLGMPLSSLLKLGVLKKDCIDYFVKLDRWQTFIIPPYNPTQKDFERPEVYTVPFLGSDVHHSRCARVVTARQAGYWGTVINQGWGISDLCGYLQSGMNYKVTMQSLPLMIQQMSILARVINVDGVLATEGSNALDALVENNTINIREISPDNPVTMDVLGDIKSIDRNFGQVPELIKLLRQDLASDSTFPEPMLFSSEKGNFSSGDDTQGNLSKQYESVKMMYRDVEPQVKQLAKILVIDALGTDSHIIEALPYTRLRFDEPVVANAVERAQIGKNFSESMFNLVSAQVPMDIAYETASKFVSKDMSPNSELLERLSEVQKKNDERDDKRFELEIQQSEADVEQTEQNTENAKESVSLQKKELSMSSVTAVSGKSKKQDPESNKKTKGRSPAEEQREKAESDKKDNRYSKLEQKKHEKTRIGMSKRSEKIGKARSKRV